MEIAWKKGHSINENDPSCMNSIWWQPDVKKFRPTWKILPWDTIALIITLNAKFNHFSRTTHQWWNFWYLLRKCFKTKKLHKVGAACLLLAWIKLQLDTDLVSHLAMCTCKLVYFFSDEEECLQTTLFFFKNECE